MAGTFVVVVSDINMPSAAVAEPYVVVSTLSVVLSLPLQLAGAFVVVVSDSDTPSSAVAAHSIIVGAALAGTFVISVKAGQFVCFWRF